MCSHGFNLLSAFHHLLHPQTVFFLNMHAGFGCLLRPVPAPAFDARKLWTDRRADSLCYKVISVAKIWIGQYPAGIWSTVQLCCCCWRLACFYAFPNYFPIKSHIIMSQNAPFRHFPLKGTVKDDGRRTRPPQSQQFPPWLEKQAFASQARPANILTIVVRGSFDRGLPALLLPET